VEENEQFRKTILDLNDRMKERLLEEAKGGEDRQKLAIKVSDLERQLSDRNNAIHRSMEEVAGLQARLTHLENLSSEKSRNAVYAVEELQHAQEEVESLHRQMELQRQSVDELTRERDTLRSQSRDLNEDRAHHEAFSQQSEAEQRKLAEKIAQMEKQMYERTIQESKNASEQERMRRQLKDALSSLEEKSAAASSLASELERVRAELVVTELEKEERLKVDANLSEKVKDQTDFLVNLQRECDTQTTTIRLMKAEMEKQAVSFDTYQKSTADLQSRYNRSQIKAQESEAAIAILEQKIEQITKSGTYKVLANIGFIPRDK
jgi:chromosome segregation ATPase